MGSTRKNSKQIVTKTTENHDWLPEGWIMESKTRKTGTRVGTQYKCYIEPSSGSKFYSKPEVLRYLKTRKLDTHPQQKQGDALESTSKSDTSPIPLFEPVPHILDSTEENDHENIEITSGAISTNDKNVVIEREQAEDLPQGWIKETKIRKTANGIRKDPSYKDPVSGRVFRSKKEVLRYLEDKLKLSSVATSWELKHPSTRREIFLAGKEDDLRKVEISAANMMKGGQGIELTATTKVDCLILTEAATGLQSTKSAITESFDTDENLDPSASNLLRDEDFAKEMEKRVSVEAGAVTPGADEQAQDIVKGKVQDSSMKTKSKPGTCNKNVNARSRYSRRLAGIEPELGATVASEEALQVSDGKSLQNRAMLDNNLDAEESQKLISVQGIERASYAPFSVDAKLDGGITNAIPNVRLVPEVKVQKLETERIIDEKPEGEHNVSPGLDFAAKHVSCELPVEDSPNTGCALAFRDELKQEDKLFSRESEKIDNVKSQIRKSKNKKENSLPRRASKRLAGVEPELIGNSISCEKPLEYTSKRSKREFSVVPSANTVLQQLEDPETENLEDEKGESHLSFSFHYSWSDPCLEFAIKTLTGALPVEDTVDVDPSLNMGKNNLQHGMDKSGMKNCQVRMGKLKKELNLPSRSSKRLAGHKPELITDPRTGERTPEYTPRKSYKESQEYSQQLDIGPKSISGIHPSNQNEMSCKAQIAPEDRQRNAEVEGTDGKKLEPHPQISFPFCDSWSDPCIDFAIKTLTGALSEEDTADVLPVICPDSDIAGNRNTCQNRDESSSDNQAVQPVKLSGCESEWMVCSSSGNSDKKQAIEQSVGEVAKVERISTNRASQHLETRVRTESGKFDSTKATASVHGAYSEKIQSGCRTLPEVPHSGSFLDPWSDPCLDFAIKTLTGAIPVEENLELPGCFQQVHTPSTQAHSSSVLPDLGLPAFFQNDISSHFDVPDKSGGVQQSSLNLPMLPPGDASFANRNSADSSLRYSEGNLNLNEGKRLP